ncbi:hypothetical protein [Streptomyces pseudovenezuelae]|uniref:Endogenous inhibitor of DNA gyrase (YacG/DUF329 family) n=1 Tax=Streptomyces pseudovenezuelae TaxID=67350 RepID=A0ABT6M3K8_9ACTN|nr:hypothetical protein [Streptomyces pseudovenezuelae]MDH6222581.1 endogenous inhibitor of DNA gyrase (YacG/DUF329 family) [Streptomyces pseudovenezuelae]
MVTATRCCAECGTQFAWTSRNPTRRFCGPKCRTRWWRTDRGRPTEQDAAPGEPTDPSAVRLGALHSCPNCGQHLTVINLLVGCEPFPGADTIH